MGWTLSMPSIGMLCDKGGSSRPVDCLNVNSSPAMKQKPKTEWVFFSIAAFTCVFFLTLPKALAQSPREVLSTEALNARSWALAPLEVTVPADIRNNLTLLREALLDEGRSATPEGQESYKAGYGLCNLLIAAVDEHDHAAVTAGYRAAQAEANTRMTNKSLDAHAPYRSSWPQYARIKDQRTEVQRQENNKSALAREKVKLDWSNRVKVLQRGLDEAYGRYRQALRGNANYKGPPCVTPTVASPVVTPPPRLPGGQTWTNTLGMKFVAVPGTDVLFCVHETRYRDYAEYARENPGIDECWQTQIDSGFYPTERSEDHPVVHVSWWDAWAFCKWLSEKEKKSYRLPTDQEWSVAVGPQEYPWGTGWPPPRGAGNYSDQSRKAKTKFKEGCPCFDFDDGFPTTAPVMSFAPNKFGLYDMGGNAWEWVQDCDDGTTSTRTIRGASWTFANQNWMKSSHRRKPKATEGRSKTWFGDFGFRIVLECKGDSGIE